MPKIDGGLLNCWRQTARKHDYIQQRKQPCKNGLLGWRMKKEDEKRKMEEIKARDQECGRQWRTPA